VKFIGCRFAHRNTHLLLRPLVAEHDIGIIHVGDYWPVNGQA